MKKRAKKLRIHRETLRQLSGQEMTHAAGGARGPLQQSEGCTADCETENFTCLSFTLGGGDTCLFC